ncbi:hypothetical protein AAGR22_18945 [Erwinia sp. HDF1-3R]|uniref:hypothetical protein n=1 Tax=Erwinia sp. HDF1-3R TaxID=3141543 RepID=UPI0031F53900
MNDKKTINNVFTLSFSGTACTRDEGEVSRLKSDKRIYSERSGYIPVRVFREINGVLTESDNAVSVRGSGENDWAIPCDKSEDLLVSGPLKIPDSLSNYVKKYASGNQFSEAEQAEGKDISALALHGANKAVASGAKVVNMIGHSRGAVAALMAAWFIYSYGNKDIQVNIFAIEPVPGPGNWWSTFTTLSPNVKHYAAIYAWDESIELSSDYLFTPVVPYPNEKMMEKKSCKASNSLWPFSNEWKNLGDKVLTPDPLGRSTSPQPVHYDLYVCRGRHSTVSGNITTDSEYDPSKNSSKVANVGDLIYLMARTYLSHWGTIFSEPCAVTNTAKELRKAIVKYHDLFDVMGGGIYRTSRIYFRPYVRRIASGSGILSWNKLYMEDVVGDPPYEQYYPVTQERSGCSWVNWYFL